MASDGVLTAGSNALVDALADAVGAAHVATDEATRDYFAHDIFSRGKARPGVVVAPANTEELVAVAKIAARTGAPLVPRGGGMSYTGGYQSDREDTILLDLTRMNRVLNIDPVNMTVTVEAGCTWMALNAALEDHKLRTPFWGPLSGVSSTIGGGVAQQNAFFGAGLHGTTSESVLAMKLVLADATVLDTAGVVAPVAAEDGPTGRTAFFRHYGPDLTGLFCGDAGALALKAEITLRLIPAPQAERWGSYEFDDAAGACAAASAIGRANLACEVFGFDPNLARLRMRRASLMSDAKTLAKVVQGQRNILGGLKEGARMVMAGREFLGDASYSLHVVVEGRTEAGVEAEFAIVNALAQEAGGRVTENTIPKVIRANPFTPLNNILGPDGERWVPVHGIVSHAQAQSCWAELDALFAARADVFEQHGVLTGYLITTLATTGVLIEPVFLWPEALEAVHEATVERDHLAKLPRHQPNPEATAVVADARKAVVEVFKRHQAAHFQIGRTYPYLESRDAPSRALLSALKAALDPDGRINPGALGLE